MDLNIVIGSHPGYQLLKVFILGWRWALEVLLWVEEWHWNSFQRLRRSYLNFIRFNLTRFFKLIRSASSNPDPH